MTDQEYAVTELKRVRHELLNVVDKGGDVDTVIDRIKDGLDTRIETLEESGGESSTEDFCNACMDEECSGCGFEAEDGKAQPEPDAWRYKEYHKMKTDGFERFAPKEPSEWVKDVDVDIVAGSVKPLFGLSTIRSTIKEISDEAYCPGEIGGEEEGKTLADKLLEVFDRG